MNILYFIPNYTTFVQPENIPMSHLVGASLAQVMVSSGPNGQSGLVLSFVDSIGRTGYYPSEQTWTDTEKGYWIGHGPGNCSSDHMKRKRQLSGHPVVLRDGNVWEIPVARYYTGGSAFPSIFVKQDGQISLQTSPEFWDISLKAEKVFSDMLLEKKSLTWNDAFDIAVDALSINYHISVDEVLELALLDTVVCEQVLGALIDLPSIRDAVKKSQLDSDFGLQD